MFLGRLVRKRFQADEEWNFYKSTHLDVKNIGLKLIETEEWKNKGENRMQRSSKCHITTNAHHCRKEKAENTILLA